jgi:hypothetical protein
MRQFSRHVIDLQVTSTKSNVPFETCCMGEERQMSIDEQRRDVSRVVPWEKVEDRRVGDAGICLQQSEKVRRQCEHILERIADSEGVNTVDYARVNGNSKRKPERHINRAGASGTLGPCVLHYQFKRTLPARAARPLNEAGEQV